LPEIGVVGADSDEKFVIFETNDVVGLVAQLGNSAELLWTIRLQSLHCVADV
jgi:hypothetical protein